VCVALVLMYHMSAGYMFAFTLMHSHVCVALGLLHHMPCVHRLAMEPHPTAVLAMSLEMTFKRIRHMRCVVTLHSMLHMLFVCLHREQPLVLMRVFWLCIYPPILNASGDGLRYPGKRHGRG